MIQANAFSRLAPLLLSALSVLLAISSLAVAQPTAAAKPSGVVASLPSTAPKLPPRGEVDVLVEPGGAAYEILIHQGKICLLSFPSDIISMSTASSTSSQDLEMKPFGRDAMSLLAKDPAPPPVTVAISTGTLKVVLTIRVVPADEHALTLVRFKAAAAGAAYEAQQRMGSSELLDLRAGDPADDLLLEKALVRNEIVSVKASAHNNVAVSARARKVLFLGDDAYLFFEIENHSASPFRLVRAAVVVDGRAVSGRARLRSSSLGADASVIGVAATGTTAYGVVMVPNATALRGRAAVLELEGAKGQGTLRLDRGIVL